MKLSEAEIRLVHRWRQTPPNGKVIGAKGARGEMVNLRVVHPGEYWKQDNQPTEVADGQTQV